MELWCIGNLLSQTKLSYFSKEQSLERKGEKKYCYLWKLCIFVWEKPTLMELTSSLKFNPEFRAFSLEDRKYFIRHAESGWTFRIELTTGYEQHP